MNALTHFLASIRTATTRDRTCSSTALLVALIAIVCVVAVTSAGTAVQAQFAAIAAAI